jgi:hypothetical protein
LNDIENWFKEKASGYHSSVLASNKGISEDDIKGILSAGGHQDFNAAAILLSKFNGGLYIQDSFQTLNLEELKSTAVPAGSYPIAKDIDGNLICVEGG